MSAPRAFDLRHYETLNRARGDVVRSLVEAFRAPFGLHSAMDVGCGVGYFSGFLRSLGFDVTAVDGRAENVEEGRRRHAGINFVAADAEDLQSLKLPEFDLVLCFGLLYHLENPFRAIRGLCALTGKILLVEGMCIPGEEPAMELLDEGVIEDQGLSYVAFYPSESCLIKMLYRAGYPFVYRLRQPPADSRYAGTTSRKRERTFLVASKVELTTDGLLVHSAEPFRAATGPANPWDRPLARFFSPRSIANLVSVRLPRFFRRPWAEKREILSWYIKKIC